MVYYLLLSIHDLQILAPLTPTMTSIFFMVTLSPNALPVSIPSSMGKLGDGSTTVVWNRDSALVM